MKVAIAVIGSLATVSLIACGYLLNNYLDEKDREVQVATSTSLNIANNAIQRPKTIGVLTASAKIDRGKLIDASMLQWQEWPETIGQHVAGQGVITASEGQYQNAQKVIEGSLALVEIAKGQTITPDMTIKRDQGSLLPVLIRPGYRAVTLAVDATSGVAGMVQPGDRVDIILTQDANAVVPPKIALKNATQGKSIPVRFDSETIMEDVKVIATDRKLSSASIGPETAIPSNITFEVTPEDAEKLIVAKRMGTLNISMRPLQTTQDLPRTGPLITTDLSVEKRTRAALLNVDVDTLNLKENPFFQNGSKVTDDVISEKKIDEGNKQEITLYRGSIPLTIHLLNGRPVTGNSGDSSLGSLPKIGSETSNNITNGAGGLNNEPSPSAPAVPQPPQDVTSPTVPYVPYIKKKN